MSSTRNQATDAELGLGRIQVEEAARAIGQMDAGDLIGLLATNYRIPDHPSFATAEVKSSLNELYTAAKTGSHGAIEELRGIALEITRFLEALETDGSAKPGPDEDCKTTSDLASAMCRIYAAPENTSSGEVYPTKDDRLNNVRERLFDLGSSLDRFSRETLLALIEELTANILPFRYFTPRSGFLEPAQAHQATQSSNKTAAQDLVEELILRLIEIRLGFIAHSKLIKARGTAAEWPIRIAWNEHQIHPNTKDLIKPLSLGKRNIHAPTWKHGSASSDYTPNTPRGFAATIYEALVELWTYTRRIQDVEGNLPLPFLEMTEKDLKHLRGISAKNCHHLRRIWELEAALLPPPVQSNKSEWAEASVSYITWHRWCYLNKSNEAPLSYKHLIYPPYSENMVDHESWGQLGLPCLVDDSHIFQPSTTDRYWPIFLNESMAERTYKGRPFKEVVRIKLVEGYKTILPVTLGS